MAFYVYATTGALARQKQKTTFIGKDGLLPGVVLLKYKDECDSSGSREFRWEITASDIAGYFGSADSIFIIHANPKAKARPSVYRLDRIYGETQYERTVLMLLLEDCKTEDKGIGLPQTIELPSCNEILVTFLYTPGYFIKGRPSERWCPPPMSPYNSVFMWPRTVEYMVGKYADACHSSYRNIDPRRVKVP